MSNWQIHVVLICLVLVLISSKPNITRNPRSMYRITLQYIHVHCTYLKMSFPFGKRILPIVFSVGRVIFVLVQF